MNDSIVVLLDKSQKFTVSDKRILDLMNRGRDVIVVRFVEMQTCIIEEKEILGLSCTYIQGAYSSCIPFLNGLQLNITTVISFGEKSVLAANTLRKDLGLAVTPQYTLFTSKNIQRELFEGSDLLQVRSVYFDLLAFKNLTPKDIDTIIGFPCIIKPSGGAGSINVHKIESRIDYANKRDSLLKSLSVESEYLFDKVLIEEYLVGQMMSIDYYVDAYGCISYSYPILQYTSDDCFGNGDFAIVRQRIGRFIEQYLDLNQLKMFIEETVSVCEIKNSFVHHELKYNHLEKVFKTIEINGRIGGNRLLVYNTIMGLNLYDLIINKRDLEYQGEKHGSIIKLYPSSIRGKFTHFTQEFIDLLEGGEVYIYRKSFSKKAGKVVGPAKEKGGHVGLLLCEFTNESIDGYELFEKKLLEFISSEKIKQLVSDYEIIQ